MKSNEYHKELEALKAECEKLRRLGNARTINLIAIDRKLTIGEKIWIR